MATISLTEEQEGRARQIYQRLRTGGITRPQEIVEWTTPTKKIDYQRKEKQFDRCRGFIDPENIVGPTEAAERLEKNKLQNVLVRLIERQFEIQNIYPSVLQKRNEKYYVMTDGLHRCLAAKALGLDRFYVEYEVVPSQLLVNL